jgi:CBS domain-containing protein
VFDGVNHNRFPPKVLTQTDVVKYLLDNADVFSEVQSSLSLTVETLIDSQGIVSVSEETSLIDALKKFRSRSALPVVNEWGKLFVNNFFILHPYSVLGQVVANLSSRDFISIAARDDVNWTSFKSMTVKQFLLRNGELTYENPAICISTEGHLFTAARYMIDNHIHHVWVVSPVDVSGVSGFCIGCVSLSDVIKVVDVFSTSLSSS